MLLRDFFIALFTYCFVFVMASIAYFLVQNQMAVDNARTDVNDIVTDFYTIILVFFLTMIVLSTLQNIRQKVQTLYVQYYALLTPENSLNVLKLHTLLIKGTQGMDMSGDKLKKDFETLYPDDTDKTEPKILALSMIPDLNDAYKIVSKIKEMKLYNKLYNEGELNALSAWLMPETIKNSAKFNMKISQLERRAETFLSDDLKNSGSAFVCFSSFEAMKEFENFIRP